MSQTGYAQPSMSIGVSPTQPQTQPHHSQTGVFWTAVVLVCTAIVALAGAFTAFIVYMRPLLKVPPRPTLLTSSTPYCEHAQNRYAGV